MSSAQRRVLWGLAGILLLFCAWRLASQPSPYAAAAPVGAVEDRRLYRFRNLGYMATQDLVEELLRRAAAAPDATVRARWLARLASLQHERGMDEPARAAAGEALRLDANDAEVQRLMRAPLDLRELSPRR